MTKVYQDMYLFGKYKKVDDEKQEDEVISAKEKV
jgi:hypothetical protein